MKKFVWIAFALLLVHLVVIAQEKLLDKKISVRYSNVTLRDALADLTKKYGISVSYSSSQIKLDTRVNVSVTNQSLRESLKTLLAGTGITFMEYGNQVILKKAEPVKKKSVSTAVKEITTKPVPVEKQEEETPEIEEIEKVTASAVAGNQTIFLQKEDIPEVKTTEEVEKVYIEQQARIYDEYFAAKDTAKVQTGKALKQDLKTAVRILKQEFERLKDSLELDQKIKRLSHIVADSAEKKETSDTTGTKVRPVQVTFIYPLGTNGAASPEYTNNVSLNVLAGVNGGVKGAEVASLVNVDKKSVEGFQAAGLVNLTGEFMDGVQVAGLVNLAKEKGRGGQFAGLVNLTGDTSDIFQAAGLVNAVNGSNFGGQFSGLISTTRGSMVGPQASGLVSFTGGNLKGFQASGLTNVTLRSMDGVQIAGLVNFASAVKGAQLGFINIGGKTEGSQIGFLNISDSISGVPLGFLSFSKKGYHKIEISGTEALYPTLAFKTGVRKFYNILTAGYQPWSDGLWWYGYGIGSELALGKRVPLNFDFVVNQINHRENNHLYLDLLGQIKVQAGVTLGKNLTVFGGPVLNLQMMKMPGYLEGKYTLAPYTIWEDSYTIERGMTNYPTKLKGWVGFSAGVRFL
jgi:hypothetical protein